MIRKCEWLVFRRWVGTGMDGIYQAWIDWLFSLEKLYNTALASGISNKHSEA